MSEKKLRTPGLDNVKIRKNICTARGKKVLTTINKIKNSISLLDI